MLSEVTEGNYTHEKSNDLRSVEKAGKEKEFFLYTR